MVVCTTGSVRSASATLAMSFSLVFTLARCEKTCRAYAHALDREVCPATKECYSYSVRHKQTYTVKESNNEEDKDSNPVTCQNDSQLENTQVILYRCQEAMETIETYLTPSSPVTEPQGKNHKDSRCQ